MNAFNETSAISLPSFGQVTNDGHENVAISTKTTHSTRNNDAFTHSGISLVFPNTFHQKYSGTLKGLIFEFVLFFIAIAASTLVQI